MKRLLCFGFLLMPFLGMGQVVDTAGVRKEVDSLVQVCRGLTGQGKFEEALQVIEQAEELALKAFGRESAGYATCVFNHGRVFYLWVKYSKAEFFYLEAKSIQEKVLGKEHSDYAASLNNLASVYFARGEYDKAEPLYLEAKTIWGTILGKESSNYVMTLNNLAMLYSDKGQYDKAESLYLEAKIVRRKTLGNEHPDYARILNNLAILYASKEQHNKAESLYLESKSIREKALGKEHPDYANSLNNLATLYQELGEYSKSESLYLEVKEIRFKILGNKHPAYASILENLANLYQDNKLHNKAEPLYLEAKAILERVRLEVPLEYARLLNSLANFYWYEEKYDEAEKLLLESKAMQEKLFGKENLDYAFCLNDLANVYTSKGKNNKAERLLLDSKEILENLLGKEHSYYTMSLRNLGRHFVILGAPDKSEPYFIEASNIQRKILQKYAAYISSQELEKKIIFIQDENDAIISFNHLTTSSFFRKESYSNTLFYKGKSLEASIRLERDMNNAPDSIRKIHSRWKGYNYLLAAELAKPIIERKNVDRLDSISNVLEKALLRASPEFAETQRQIQSSDVRTALQSNEAAIEIIHYRYHDKKLTDSTMYSALILLPNDTAPHFIPLCEERQLDALIYKPNGTRANYLQNLYSSPRTDGLTSLYQLIWAPIEKVLKENGIKTVYYAPSGLLHRLNLAAIAPDKTGQTLADRYHLVPVASTRQLVTDHSAASTPTSAIIYGGVRYDMDSTAITRANKDLSATAQDTTGGLFRYAARGGERADNWDTLPGTKREAKYLYELLSKRGINATLRLGYAATEESMKQIGQQGPSPSLLHIGTHGFFFPDPKDTTRRRANFGDDAPVFKISEHPLIRSGLKLAGSKYAWENKHPMGGMEDGILTAYEVSQMNLSNTQLVVLSACETGLGDIKGNEGVYGLQRAFRIAGAKNVLMSLWKVPDEATEKLMTQFYKNWLEQKMPLRVAFESAQKWLRGQKGYENPYFWAGFVLIGEL